MWRQTRLRDPGLLLFYIDAPPGGTIPGAGPRGVPAPAWRTTVSSAWTTDHLQCQQYSVYYSLCLTGALTSSTSLPPLTSHPACVRARPERGWCVLLLPLFFVPREHHFWCLFALLRLFFIVAFPLYKYNSSFCRFFFKKVF